MASESVMQELYQVAKVSTVFKGMADDDILKACEDYKDRSDEDIQVAIENIKSKDNEAAEKVAQQKASLEHGHEMMIALHQQEESEREADSQSAEELLADLFNP